MVDCQELNSSLTQSINDTIISQNNLANLRVVFLGHDTTRFRETNKSLNCL